MKNVNQNTRMICEAAICVALAIGLSYLKLDLWFQGGSVDAVMIPLILFSVRWGAGWGTGACLVFGTLKYFIGLNSWALDWVSILFDYAVAYALVGLAGLFRRRSGLILPATLVGCGARFLIHYISGVTVYAKWMPEEFMGMAMTSPYVYSALYNGGYMLPNTILAAAVCLALAKAAPIRSWLDGRDLG